MNFQCNGGRDDPRENIEWPSVGSRFLGDQTQPKEADHACKDILEAPTGGADLSPPDHREA